MTLVDVGTIFFNQAAHNVELAVRTCFAQRVSPDDMGSKSQALA
jgi:hypothetical protein